VTLTKNYNSREVGNIYIVFPNPPPRIYTLRRFGVLYVYGESPYRVIHSTAVQLYLYA
jgi:hypothetical protein